MVKYSRSLVMLLGSASLFAFMATKPLKAENLEDDQSFFTRMTAAPKNLWNALPSVDDVKSSAQARGADLWNALPSVDDVKSSVQAKGTAFAKQKAQDFLDKNFVQVSDMATKKFHALMYRHADLHIVDDEGKHIGFIEDVNPRVGRNLIKKALGFDLDRDIPGVPTFMAKAVVNVIEKQAANYLEATFQKNLNKALTQLSMEALQRGLGLAQTKVSEALENKEAPATAPAVSSPASIDEEEQAIKAALVKETPVNESVDQEDLSAMSELVMAIQANLKLKIHSWLNEVANETATSFTTQFVNQTGEQMLRGTEVAAGAATTLAAGVVTGGTGAVVLGGLISGDHYIAENVPGEESYMRQALKWLTSYDTRKEEIQQQITTATTNQINANIDNVLEKVKLGSLRLTEKDYDLVYGKYAAVEDDFGFTNLEKVEDAYSFTTFGNKVTNHFKMKAATVLRQAQEGVSNLAEAAEDFALALGPGLAYEPPEPTDKEILQDRAIDALEKGDVEEITKVYLEAKEMREAEEQAAKKSWWKIW